MRPSEAAPADPPGGSLRLQLLRWLLLPLFALLLVNATLSNRAAVATADQAYDRLLTASADAIADQVSVQDGQLRVDLPYVALQLLESNIQERVFYRVVAPDGSTVTGYADLPLPPGSPGERDAPALYTAQYQGDPVHLVALRRPLFGTALTGTVTVVVAETGESRQALSRHIVVEDLARQGLLIAATGVLVWLGLQRGLQPLIRLRDRVRARSPGDLSPIPASHLPSELRPLIEAINLHTARIDHLIESRQRFLADASHQMRTPLAEMQTQIAYSLRQQQFELAQATLREVHGSLEGLGRLVTQMLSLARSDPSAQQQQHRPIDLAELARSAALEGVPAARKKRIDLSFEAGPEPVIVLGEPLLLREMVGNLVDNAVRYAHRDGAIAVGIACRPAADGPGREAVLEVDDDGPGIPPDLRDKALQRFFRAAPDGVPGSGLGLAIVAEICQSHGASIALLDGRRGRGLCVRITLPCID